LPDLSGIVIINKNCPMNWAITFNIGVPNNQHDAERGRPSPILAVYSAKIYNIKVVVAELARL